MHGHDEPMKAIPSVGEHTNAILGELGYSNKQIDELVASGVAGR